MGYSKYICPVCQEEMERDIQLFLEHTNRHIHAAVKRLHPEWVDGSGECDRCDGFLQEHLVSA